MKISKKCKLKKVAYSGQNLAMRYLYFDAKNKDNPVMVSTNGKSMAIIPVESDKNDVEGCVDPDALTTNRKMSKGDDVYIPLRKPNESFPKPNVYPNWRIVIPNSKYKPVIAINAKELKKLADALGDDNVLLSVSEDESISIKSAIQVNTESGAYGLIMPLRNVSSEFIKQAKTNADVFSLKKGNKQ